MLVPLCGEGGYVQVWPEEDFPLQPVGTLTLDRNIDNFHNESEQIAFNPAATIGGMFITQAYPPLIQWAR
jgi:catalase